MGDNRDRSLDSRFWGFVKKEDLVGRALIIYFSWNGNADDIVHYVRWERIGRLIR
jgi:signal peptidase I